MQALTNFKNNFLFFQECKDIESKITKLNRKTAQCVIERIKELKNKVFVPLGNPLEKSTAINSLVYALEKKWWLDEPLGYENFELFCRTGEREAAKKIIGKIGEFLSLQEAADMMAVCHFIREGIQSNRPIYNAIMEERNEYIIQKYDSWILEHRNGTSHWIITAEQFISILKNHPSLLDQVESLHITESDLKNNDIKKVFADLKKHLNKSTRLERISFYMVSPPFFEIYTYIRSIHLEKKLSEGTSEEISKAQIYQLNALAYAFAIGNENEINQRLEKLSHYARNLIVQFTPLIALPRQLGALLAIEDAVVHLTMKDKLSKLRAHNCYCSAYRAAEEFLKGQTEWGFDKFRKTSESNKEIIYARFYYRMVCANFVIPSEKFEELKKYQETDDPENKMTPAAYGKEAFYDLSIGTPYDRAYAILDCYDVPQNN